MKDVTLNQSEQARLSVLNSVLEYQAPIAQAAELLGVSPRHTRRMLAAYREHGAAMVELATQRYQGANHTHFTELLSKREGIDLSRPTVRRILTRAGIGSPRSRRSPQHRSCRHRRRIGIPNQTGMKGSIFQSANVRRVPNGRIYLPNLAGRTKSNLYHHGSLGRQHSGRWIVPSWRPVSNLKICSLAR